MRIALVALVVLVVLAAAIVAFAVIGPFEDDGDERPAEVTVDAIVSTPPLWFREAVRIDGTALVLDDERFLLEGDERTIIVWPEPGAVEGEIESGEQVNVTGFVYWLDRSMVSELRRVLREADPPPHAAADIAVNDPYVEASRVDATG